MPKKIVVALMLAVTFLGAIYIVIGILKRNESVTFSKSHTWYVDVDPAGSSIILVRGKKVGEIKHDVNKLILALNKAVVDAEILRPRGEGVATDFPVIRLQKIEQRTADIEIQNDLYLTQSMGSAGAQGYLAEVTFTLTEMPGVKTVNFIFTEGDNAAPGLYSRESFTGLKLVSE